MVFNCVQRAHRSSSSAEVPDHNKGSVVELLFLNGVDCGSGKVVHGGVVGIDIANNSSSRLLVVARVEL